MKGMEKKIQNTLKNPQCIRKSKTDTYVRLYYRYYEKTIVSGKWLCVVVKYLQEDAFVVTAYLTDKVKSGEEICLKN